VTKFELLHARTYSEGTLLNILDELGAEIRYTMGFRQGGQIGPIGFQVFWPELAND
jgi:hypothetical protein